VREIEFFVYLNSSLYENDDRIRVRLRLEKGKLLDVMYQYETFDDSEWLAIVRFDCSHGQTFHKDLMYPNGDKEKIAVEVFSLEEFSLYARYDLELKWEFYKEWYFTLKRRRK
jgi:hypothetical protein